MAGAIPTFLQNLAKVLAIGAAFASLPLFASFASLQPPWPPAIGPVSAALVLLSSLIVWEWTRRSRIRNRRRLILGAVIVTLLGLGLYLALYSLFVDNLPGQEERIVRGYACTADAKLVYKDSCPDLPQNALSEAGGEHPERILWTRSSITAVRMALTTTWLLFMAGLIMSLSAVIAGRKF